MQTAVDLDTVSGGKSELSVVDFGVVSDAEGVVSDAEVEQLAQELENIFTTYLSQNNAGHWFVTAAGYGSNIKQSDLEVIAARLNSKISVNNAGMQTRSSDYAKCVIDVTGLGAIGGLFTGAFTKLIEKELWKEAALYIVKIVGKMHLKVAL